MTAGRSRTEIYKLRKELRDTSEFVVATTGGPTPEQEVEARTSLEDRKILIRFTDDVINNGGDERVWKAKYPKDYERVIALCGTVDAPHAR